MKYAHRFKMYLIGIKGLNINLIDSNIRFDNFSNCIQHAIKILYNSQPNNINFSKYHSAKNNSAKNLDFRNERLIYQTTMAEYLLGEKILSHKISRKNKTQGYMTRWREWNWH